MTDGVARPTSDVVGDVEAIRDILVGIGEKSMAVAAGDAAVRLGDLDVLINKLAAQVAVIRSQQIELDNMRPPCPKCGGTMKGEPGISVTGEKSWAHCTDCLDGKIPWTRMIHIVELIFSWEPTRPRSLDPEWWTHYASGQARLLEHLKGVR